MPRYIDADAVFRWYVETFSEKNNGERAIQPNEIRFSMNDIRDNLDNIPTIDAEPVRNGRWLDNGKYDGYTMYICSECNHAESITYNYCPDCGAKMDGGEEDASN